MLEIDSKLQQVLVIYILINIGIYYYKPSFCFNEDGGFKEFGVGDNKTIVPFWLITLVLSLFIYVYMCVKMDYFV